MADKKRTSDGRKQTTLGNFFGIKDTRDTRDTNTPASQKQIKDYFLDGRKKKPDDNSDSGAESQNSQESKTKAIRSMEVDQKGHIQNETKKRRREAISDSKEDVTMEEASRDVDIPAKKIRSSDDEMDELETEVNKERAPSIRSFGKKVSSKKYKKKQPKTIANENEEKENAEAIECEMETKTKDVENGEEDEQLDEKEDKAVVAKLASTLDWKPGQQGTVVWKKGEKVPYSALCNTFALIETTTKRLEILEHTTNFFRTVIELSPESLLEALYLCLNKLCPDYEGLELGIGESFLMKAIAQSTGRDMQSVKTRYQECGDLGTVAMDSRATQRTLFSAKALTIPQVFKTLKEIANSKGTSSQNRKIDKIKGLLVACQGNEAKYLIRSLEGKLRIGLAEKTVMVALVHAVVLAKPETKKMKKTDIEVALQRAAGIVKAVYNELPCYDLILPALLREPVEKLAEFCKMTPGVPLKPMLAHPTKALSEILDRFEGHTFTCEFKYDGERAQIHKLPDDTARIYSRNSENMSVRYPDIIDRLDKWIKPEIKSFVLDCEAVAWDREKKCILPFQVLSTRKRKDVKEDEITVQVCVFAFDILYLNGEPLIQKPLEERRKLLHESTVPVEGEFDFARNMDTNNIEDIQAFLDTSIANNCEGLMVKMFNGPEATYEPSKRSRNWLKVKKDYLSGIGDSIDLVVVGAFYGRGKRTGAYGAFLLACYDPDREEYQTITKIGTGFSDEDLQKHYEFFKDKVIEKPKKYYNYGEGTKPDVWFEPVQVWEVLSADLSISPKYKAAVGITDPSKGISLRFPRFIRVRDDKKPEQATSSDQIAEFYNKQVNSNKASSGTVGGVDDDFEY